MLLIAYGFFSLGSFIQTQGQPILDFCYKQNRNDTFLKTIKGIDIDTPQPAGCDDKQGRTGWWGYCNFTCSEKYDECLKVNATEDQIKFSQNCHWMGPDYLILVGIVAFKWMLPLGLLVMLFSILYQNYNEEKV